MQLISFCREESLLYEDLNIYKNKQTQDK